MDLLGQHVCTRQTGPGLVVAYTRTLDGTEFFDVLPDAYVDGARKPVTLYRCDLEAL